MAYRISRTNSAVDCALAGSCLLSKSAWSNSEICCKRNLKLLNMRLDGIHPFGELTAGWHLLNSEAAESAISTITQLNARTKIK